MRVKSAILGWAFLTLLGNPLYSQETFGERYLEKNYSMENGLSCDFIDDVLFDQAGYLWIATSGGGVCRLDGYDVLSFKESSVPSLKSSFVRALCEDNFHRLWIASEGGLDVLDLLSLQTVDMQLPVLSDSENPVCTFITIDKSGAVWAKFGATLWRFSFGADGSISESRSFTDERLDVRTLVFKDVDADGCVWVCLGGVIHKVIPTAEGGLRATPLFPGLNLGEETYVSDYLVYGARLWVSTEQGLYLLYKSTGEWKRYVNRPGDSRSLTQNFVTSLSVTDDGEIIASTLHGFNVYNPVSDDFERVGTDVINGIEVFGDRLFVATETRGLSLLTPRQLNITHYTHSDLDAGSLSSGAVNAICQMPSGQLWVGTVEGGLNILEPGQKRFSHLTLRSGSLSHNSVSELEPYSDERMFVGTWGGGIDVVSSRRPYRVLSHLSGGEGFADYVGVLEYDEKNELLWVGSNRGIFMYKPGEKSWMPALDETAEGCIGSCLDSHGQLWIGSLQGLFVFNLEEPLPDGRFPYVHYRYRLDRPDSKIRETICAIKELSDGTMCLGSNGGGFYKAYRQVDSSYTFVNYSTLQGLSNDRVRGFCEEAGGAVWVSTDHGLNRLDVKRNTIVSYLREDGLAGVRFHWNNAFQGADGKMYFGHEQGFSVLSPSPLSDIEHREDVLRMTEIKADGRLVTRDPFVESLTLHENNRSIEFRFALLVDDARERVLYRIRMKGYDRQWNLLETGEHSVSYTSLPHGNYNFQIEAVNHAGSLLGTFSLPVHVRAAFYHTAWFWLLLILSLGAAVWAYVKWRIRKLYHQQLVLEGLVEERTRELREKAEKLNRQNSLLIRQNEELASRKILFAPERRSREDRKEDVFMEKALEVLRQHYKDPELDVDMFCKAIGMSKTSLNSRLQEAAGMSIGQLVRTYRLSVAREMLENTSMNVSEVAYEVGFNDPKYFTRCFVKEYAMSPSSVAKAGDGEKDQ